MTGQELGDGPGGARGGPLLALTQLTAFIDGVYQQEERLLRRLDTQERQEDTSEDRRIRERKRTVITFSSFWLCLTNKMSSKFLLHNISERYMIYIYCSYLNQFHNFSQRIISQQNWQIKQKKKLRMCIPLMGLLWYCNIMFYVMTSIFSALKIIFV